MQIQLSMRDERTIAIKLEKFSPEHIARIKNIPNMPAMTFPDKWFRFDDKQKQILRG
ncbi:hypothetical protein H1230_06705 [Paenibacillus sp. 19GGS1-52]|uniref:hypothetical protein n=1 Tax=Paenibacillus sp. 19GGS1-52 TaxID=2758563 RepID=UPI001EFC12E5|nr:hypothetical protein [Paenibacillus sp. 19GGS1-52]ULO08492.1 hypothetical protein H1230_06705 [Paenibacillus sp. 19GGS1-52]